MPIYEYRCEACEAVTEHFLRSRQESGPQVCKSCGGGPLSRLISRSAFHLKGEGWYTTDYKKSGGGSSASSEASSSASSGSSSSCAHDSCACASSSSASSESTSKSGASSSSSSASAA